MYSAMVGFLSISSCFGGGPAWARERQPRPMSIQRATKENRLKQKTCIVWFLPRPVHPGLNIHQYYSTSTRTQRYRHLPTILPLDFQCPRGCSYDPAMPIPTPFHDRTAPLCTSLRWKDWAGFHAVCRYGTHLEAEYHAIRQSAGLLDVSPLTKIVVDGPDAAAFLSFVTTRDLSRLRKGRVRYVAVCDEEGKLVDDGTVMNLGENKYRLTAASPLWRWVDRFSAGFDVTITDQSDEIASLAIQGPRSRAIVEEALGEVIPLRYFQMAATSLAGIPVEISRTGYTGDLGYELWCQAEHSTALWDRLMAAGKPHRLLPIGLDALDIVRIEAGYILQGVDYHSAPTCLIEGRKSSPFEAGIGFAVDLHRAPFVGSEALEREKRMPPRWKLVGLELSLPEIEKLYATVGLPPTLAIEASRISRPVHLRGQQVGYVTSSTFSPILKS
ncbi:MAG TPA: aminomethyl transferase family protein, partial [Planctomycetes bacterium]|nr:aminomethyl transferase family protein [Planctomycetota bacterium]